MTYYITKFTPTYTRTLHAELTYNQARYIMRDILAAYRTAAVRGEKPWSINRWGFYAKDGGDTLEYKLIKN